MVILLETTRGYKAFVITVSHGLVYSRMCTMICRTTMVSYLLSGSVGRSARPELVSSGRGT